MEGVIDRCGGGGEPFGSSGMVHRALVGSDFGSSMIDGNGRCRGG